MKPSESLDETKVPRGKQIKNLYLLLEDNSAHGIRKSFMAFIPIGDTITIFAKDVKGTVRMWQTRRALANRLWKESKDKGFQRLDSEEGELSLNVILESFGLPEIDFTIREEEEDLIHDDAAELLESINNRKTANISDKNLGPRPIKPPPPPSPPPRSLLGYPTVSPCVIPPPIRRLDIIPPGQLLDVIKKEEQDKTDILSRLALGKKDDS